MAGLDPAKISRDQAPSSKFVMPGLDPRLSGSIFMDRVHDVDSSVF
jgi:hypothetical protein